MVTLFVAFGFLEWYEASSSDIPIRSPLLLIPVELLHESAKSTYKLTIFEEDITLNPALVHKMETDFRLSLPELPDPEQMDLRAFFNDVAGRVEHQHRWSVVPEAYLGLFSFHKMAMYRDLEAHSNRACEHPIVRALAGDPSRLSSIPTDLPRETDLDRRVLPESTYQILDADSSQQEAIQAAKRGVSFILQGPPGTGKSQTIANIIAESLADGKRVLFVSEKMAALEVVYRRLTDHGLGEFCLQLHSHKANKREVVEELDRTLKPSPQITSAAGEDYAELLRLRERLNAYVTALHAIRQPINRTVYQVHGEMARLINAPDLDFSFEKVAECTPRELEHINELLDELVRLHDVIVSYKEYPWFGVSIPSYNPHQTKADIRVHFSALTSLLDELEDKAASVADLCGVDRPGSLVEVDRILRLAELVSTTPHPPASWFRSGASMPLIEAARAYQARFTDYHRRRNALLQVYQESVFDLPHADLEARLTTRHQTILDRVKPGGGSAGDILIRQRDVLQTALVRISQLLERLGHSVPALAMACALDVPNTLTSIGELCTTAELLAHDPRPKADWFDRSRLVTLRAEVEEARSQYTALSKSRDYIHARYEDSFLTLDHATLLGRFTSTYSGFLRIFHPGYYRDLKALRSVLVTPGQLSYKDAVRDLKMGRQYIECKQWIEERQAVHARDLGHHFNGSDTSWDSLLNSLETCRSILDRLGDGHVPEGLIRLLVESGPSIEMIRGKQGTVKAQLHRLEQELNDLQQSISLEPLPFTEKRLCEAELDALKTWVDEIIRGIADFCAAWDVIVACRKANADTHTGEIAATISDLREARSLEQIKAAVQSRTDKLRVTFGHLFDGMETCWEEVLASLEWTGRVLDWFGTTTPPAAFVAVASGEKPGAEQVGDLLPELQKMKQRADEEVTYACNIFSGASPSVEGQPFDQAPLKQAHTWIQTRLDRLADLDKWMDFQRLLDECCQAGLGSFLEAIIRDTPEATLLKPTFYKRFWALWLGSIYPSEKTLARFDGQRHETCIARFRELDRAQIEQAQRRLLKHVSEHRPAIRMGDTPTGEMSVLLREIGKKRRHKPLRQLFAEIPNLLLALKPCLLMSPLSVATFLDTNAIEFDLVLFDEASQICSEDAVGAIMRGKQLIVVGDSKQLPPTRFFATSLADEFDTEEEEEEAAADVYESILDECATIGLPHWLLRWHYRSRCEALIAFSNHHFYENRLVTFPAPYLQQGDGADRCVEFVYVPNGVYIRGKGRDAGTNRTEARKVAELVFQHFATAPHRSLGVIAFSERQQAAIDDEIRRLRTIRPEFERFFSETGDEPFFIKNLENVQGDERDVVLFSVGYAHDPTGRLSMNFGPLNKEGGERRLNVAITRAKHRVKLVCSIQPHDMDLTRTSAKGPALLKYYMEYAQRGPSALARELTVSHDSDFGSPFEEEVCRALEARGLTVHRQVGCAGYRIDLAMVDNEHPGRYLLGIECDGATYHSSKTARDRDRLRQQVLEEMGWRGRILRIWSSDWIRNPEAQVSRVLEALKSAHHAAEDIEERTSLTNTSVVPETSDSEPYEDDDDEELTIGNVRDETVKEETNGPPEGTIFYQKFTPRRMGKPQEFYDLVEYKPGKITDVLIEVVQQEGPIHIIEATRRVIACWGMSKAGRNLLLYVKQAAQRAMRGGRIRIEQDFLWPNEMQQVVIRVPQDGDTVRNIDHIPLEEIAEACCLCVRSAVGIRRNELVIQIARLLGYNRTGKDIQKRVEEGISFCVRQGRLEIKDDNVSLVRKP